MTQKTGVKHSTTVVLTEIIVNNWRNEKVKENRGKQSPPQKGWGEDAGTKGEVGVIAF